MITIRSKTIFLCACLLEAVWLLVAQSLGSMPLLLPCLAVFLVLVAWAAIKNMAVPVILFFLPFAPLLKIRPGMISFFTIALLLVYGIYTVTSIRNVRIVHLVPALCLIALTLVVKTLYGYSLDNSYVLFAITLLLVPFIVQEMNGQYGFYCLTLFFVVGIALAAITARYLAVIPTITRYIDINTNMGFIRRSGYCGDPNFYSTHITTALSGVLILFLHNEKKRRLFALILMVAVLFYCGLMSVSKSFLLVGVSLLLIWLVDLLFRKGKVSVKLALLFTFMVAALFFLSSTVFTDLLGTMISRFGGDNNLADFTTGRTKLWINYIETIAGDPMLLLFGKGYTDVTVGGRGSHNTLIQLVFQFGLVGCVLFAGWLVCFVRTLLEDAKVRWGNLTQVAILMMGAFGPWMALEYLFFDELFLLPIYVCAAMRFLSDQNQAESPLIEQHRVSW